MNRRHYDHGTHEELPKEHEDRFIQFLHAVIHLAVRVLAILMVFVIIWGVADVAFVLHERLMSPPFLFLKIDDIVATFGAFLAVLIAIEIFLNITLYIRKDVLPVKLVIATALMAVSRKVILFGNNVDPLYVLAIALVIIALGITYWLISKNPSNNGDPNG